MCSCDICGELGNSVLLSTVELLQVIQVFDVFM